MILVVLDTNIIISGLVFYGPPRQILKRIIEGDIKLIISEEIIKEVIGVLEGEKFRYPPKIATAIMNELISIFKFVEPKKKLEIIKKDPDDNMVLECALETKVNYIISGNSHLLELNKFNNIPIKKPADFLKIFDK